MNGVESRRSASGLQRSKSGSGKPKRSAGSTQHRSSASATKKTAAASTQRKTAAVSTQKRTAATPTAKKKTAASTQRTTTAASTSKKKALASTAKRSASQTSRPTERVRMQPAAKAAAIKRRRMTWKERLTVVVVIAAAIFLVLLMFVNMKIFPATQLDEFGREYSVRISLMDKFRGWQPFLNVDGELESKEYSLETRSDIEGVVNGILNDGLDLDQIQEGQFTVLFLGTDESRSNTDVMMLALFDIRANYIHILQIPRDSFVPGYTSFEGGKINSVYTMGNPNKTPVQRVVDCIESVFKIPIDRYITTSCNDIVEIVDLIGGVPIDMPYTIVYEADKIINAGKQVLNGQQSEWMVRFRHDYSEGDIGRMKAQRIFMAAAMARVCDIGTLELMTYVNTMIDKELIGSNLTVDEISKLSDFATAIGMERITMHMLPGEGYLYQPPLWKDYPEYSVWSIHKEPTINLLNEYFRPYFEPIYDLPIPELVTAGNYRNTMYDTDSTDFQAIEDGDTFDGG